MNDPASTSIEDLLRRMDAESCSRVETACESDECASNVPLSGIEHNRDRIRAAGRTSDRVSHPLERRTGIDKRFVHLASGFLSLVFAVVFHLTFGVDERLVRFIDVVHFQAVGNSTKTTRPISPEVVFTVDTNLVMLSFFLFRAFSHFGLMIPSVYDHYETFLRQGTNPYGWFRVPVCASLLTGLVALEVGLRSVFYLASLWVIHCVMAMLAYLGEREFHHSGGTAVPKARLFILLPAMYVWGSIFYCLQTVTIQIADRGHHFNEYSGQCVYFMFGLYCSLLLSQLTHFKYKSSYDTKVTFYLIFDMMTENALAFYCIRAFFV